MTGADHSRQDASAGSPAASATPGAPAASEGATGASEHTRYPRLACRSCHAPIFFGLTSKRRRIPLDSEPVEDGNVVIAEHGPVLPVVHLLTALDVPKDADAPRFVSHFATCPDAGRFRR